MYKQAVVGLDTYFQFKHLVSNTFYGNQQISINAFNCLLCHNLAFLSISEIITHFFSGLVQRKESEISNNAFFDKNQIWFINYYFILWKEMNKKESARALPIANNSNEVPHRIDHLKCKRKQNQPLGSTIDMVAKNIEYQKFPNWSWSEYAVVRVKEYHVK